jgi:hypothetical protein
MYSKNLLEFYTKVKEMNDNFDVEFEDDAAVFQKREYAALKAEVIKFHRDNTSRTCPYRYIFTIHSLLVGKRCRPIVNLFDEIETAVRKDLEALEKMDQTALRLRAVKLAGEAVPTEDNSSDLAKAEARVISAAIDYAKVPKSEDNFTKCESEASVLVPDGPVDIRQLCLRAKHMNFAYECQQKCGFDPDERDPGDDEELLAEAALIAVAVDYNTACEKDAADKAPDAKRARV